MKKKICLCLFYWVLYLMADRSFVLAADSVQRLIVKGNDSYKSAGYEGAISLYNQALAKDPGSALLNFNIGTAYFKEGEYDKAAGFFEKSALCDDKALEAKANYNLGNSRYKSAKVKEGSNLSEAVSLMRQALDYYKRAIRLNENDKDAKINHEITERQLKGLLDRLSKEKEQQKEQCPLDKQQTDNSSEEGQTRAEEKSAQEKGGESQQAHQESASKQPGAVGNEGKEDAPEESDHQDKGQEDKKPPEVPGSYADKSDDRKGLSEEEARMLLENYGQQDKLPISLRGGRAGYPEKADKDW